MLHRFFGEFGGKLTAPKWKALAKRSLPTARRDLKDLVDRGILIRNPGGIKNTSNSIGVCLVPPEGATPCGRAYSGPCRPPIPVDAGHRFR